MIYFHDVFNGQKYMILTTKILQEQLNNYSNPNNKIKRMVKKRELYPIRKGLYENNENVSPKYLANAIYGPSYISFNYALSYYGLIPEAVHQVTSATMLKGKKKEYSNAFGNFSYRDIPAEAYPYGINIITENGYSYMIATKEKALCDKLYELPNIKNQKDLENVLFEDMRIDRLLFEELNRQDIFFIAPKYYSNNLKLLVSYLRRRKYHE